MKMWFPVIESDTNRRLALGVFMPDDQEAPNPEAYFDKLALRIQGLADQEPPQRVKELIDDYLPGSMADPETLGDVMMESDTLAVILAEAVVDELRNTSQRLPEQERKWLEQEALQMNLENLLAAIT